MVNPKIEQQLRRLWQDSLEQNTPAVHVVTQILLAHYLEGTAGEFAKWACRFTPGLQMNVGIDGGQEVLPGEFSASPSTAEEGWVM